VVGLHQQAARFGALLGEERRQDDVGRRHIVEVAAEIESQHEQPELLLFAAVPRVRHLVVAVLVAREHPDWHGFRRYHAQFCNTTHKHAKIKRIQRLLTRQNNIQ